MDDDELEAPEQYVIGQAQRPKIHWIVLLAESLLNYQTWRELLTILRRLETREDRTGPSTGKPKN